MRLVHDRARLPVIRRCRRVFARFYATVGYKHDSKVSRDVAEKRRGLALYGFVKYVLPRNQGLCKRTGHEHEM